MEHTGQFVRRGPINPFVDWGFKYIFGREENKDLLMGFLNQLLGPEIEIDNIRYLNTELLGDNPELKRCVVDVLATDAAENRYLIEMQNASDHFIRQRLLYYACRLVDQMGQQGIAVTGNKIADGIARWQRNAFVKQQIINHFKKS